MLEPDDNNSVLELELDITSVLLLERLEVPISVLELELDVRASVLELELELEELKAYPGFNSMAELTAIDRKAPPHESPDTVSLSDLYVNVI